MLILMHITNAISSARAIVSASSTAALLRKFFGHQRTFGIENMGTSDAVVILNKVRCHANTGLRRITEDRDALKMSWLITLEAQFF